MPGKELSLANEAPKGRAVNEPRIVTAEVGTPSLSWIEAIAAPG
jgi:hypothetical protein